MAQVLEVGSSPTSQGSHIPEFQSWARLFSDMTKGGVCVLPMAPHPQRSRSLEEERGRASLSPQQNW